MCIRDRSITTGAGSGGAGGASTTGARAGAEATGAGVPPSKSPNFDMFLLITIWVVLKQQVQ